MKYVISLAVVLTLCLATANAQEPVETCATGSATIEMAERPASDLNDNYQPMELKDASFPTEQDVETLMEEYVLHPDQTTKHLEHSAWGLWRRPFLHRTDTARCAGCCVLLDRHSRLDWICGRHYLAVRR